MRIRIALAAAAVFFLAGCSLLTSTTDAVTNGVSAGVNATTKSTESTTNASVTEPGSPEYARAEAYVASQFSLIRRDAAAGGGENTAALAALLGETDTEAFGRWMQAHYGELFAGLDRHEDLLARIVAQRS